MANDEGFTLETNAFPDNYKRIAAVLAGVLLLAGIIFTMMMLKESTPSITSNEKPIQKNETNKIIPAAPAEQGIKNKTDTILNQIISGTEDETKPQIDSSYNSSQTASNTSITGTRTFSAGTETEKTSTKKKLLYQKQAMRTQL